MYNHRLKITESDYIRLESLLTQFLQDQNPYVTQFVGGYFQRAKNESYSNTRIMFDLYHYLSQYCLLYKDICQWDSYDFIRGLYNYLNDDTLESALSSILTPVINERLQAQN